MKFEGVYRGIVYKISYIEDEEPGPYFDILIVTRSNQSKEMASTFQGAIDKLTERLRMWDLGANEINMTIEQAAKRIGEWKAAWTLLKALGEDEREGEQARLAMITMIQTSIDLGVAGYRINKDETDWH